MTHHNISLSEHTHALDVVVPQYIQAGVKTQAGEESYESNVPESGINGLFHTYARKCAYRAPLEHLATKKKKVQCQNPRCRLSKKRTST